MVFHPENQTGSHALDLIQQNSAQIGYGWLSGLAANLTTSSTAIESEWTAGSVLFDGVTVDVPGGAITHSAGDSSNPRWDALAVTDSSGTVQVIEGTPSPVAQDDEGNIYRGESAWTPSPSDQITREMAVFALGWIPPGASTNDDLTNTSAGGVAEPVVDRRVESPGVERQTTRAATITSSGWYRIASVGPVEDGATGTPGDLRATARFSVRDAAASLQSEKTFWASLFFHNNPTLSLQNGSYFAGTHGAITDIRIVHPDDTYEGGAVEVNVQLQGNSSVPVEYTIADNYTDRGWAPEPWTAGSVPTNFDTTELDLSSDPIQAVAANGVNDMFAVQRDGTVITEQTQQRNVATVARRNTDLTIPPESTTMITTVPFDTATDDDWGAWDLSSGMFTVPQDGWYSIDFQGRMQSMPSGTRVGTHVAATGYPHQRRWINTGQGGIVSAQGYAQLDLVAGDTIKINLRQNSGSDQTLGGVPSETFCAITYEG